ncbi:hypothetical protein [Streptomyces sp. NPDC049555]|uniref:hypothetical protein n=1 Tax=unclassified Streptomyces TaxID=2593676 RepID=UPI0034149E0D
MSALAALALTSCALVRDDSLEDVLKAFQLQLPQCEVDGTKYSGSAVRSEEQLSLSFRAPRDCVDGYLRSHGEDPTKPSHWPYGKGTMDGVELSPTRPPFSGDVAKDMGWRFDPGRTYDSYSFFETPNGARFKVVVDPTGDKQTVYMTSIASPQRRS